MLKKIWQMLVFIVRVRCLISYLLYIWVRWKLKIADLKYTKDRWEHENKNKVEKHEDTEIKEDFLHHCNQIWQIAIYPQIEECFKKHDKSLEYQPHICYLLYKLVLSSICAHLSYCIYVSTPYVTLVYYIPFVLDVYSKALLYQLGHIIYEWINQTNHHQSIYSIHLYEAIFLLNNILFRKEFISILVDTCRQKVDLKEIWDIIIEYQHKDQVYTCSRIVIFSCILDPFELN